MSKIKVLIVDDSALVRQTLTSILVSDAQIEVMPAAADPFIAASRMREEAPDVIILDIEMPRMDGLTFLQKLMSQHPLPVVICSGVAAHGSENALKAMEYGAVEIIHKPQLGTRQFLEESRVLICDAIHAASTINRQNLKKIIPLRTSPKFTADVVLHKASNQVSLPKSEKVIVVGASTGGTEALRVFLGDLPENAPGVIVVQHMPEQFTASFAQRLNEECRIEVKEATSGDKIKRGCALIAPGNHHLLLKHDGQEYCVEVKEGPLVSRHRPSVDVLFRSASRYAGKNAIGILMTGMGDDGAKGLKEMKEAGAFTIAQDESTCIVFGMPQEAIKLGAVDKILPLEKIAEEVLKACGRLTD